MDDYPSYIKQHPPLTEEERAGLRELWQRLKTLVGAGKVTVGFKEPPPPLEPPKARMFRPSANLYMAALKDAETVPPTLPHRGMSPLPGHVVQLYDDIEFMPPLPPWPPVH